MPEVKRQTAHKCSIKTLLDGTYLQRPGWEPNYIQFNDRQISRLNLMAVIVNREGNSLTLDDGTSQIQIMIFGEQEKFSMHNVGDLVLIIGRPREYNQKIFIVPEIIRKIEDKTWIEYRKLELNIQNNNTSIKDPQNKENIFEKEISNTSTENQTIKEKEEQNKSTLENFDSENRFDDNYASIILNTIKKLDKGDGANVNEVIKESKLTKADKYIISLINEGEIFEIRTGRLKILE